MGRRPDRHLATHRERSHDSRLTTYGLRPTTSLCDPAHRLPVPPAASSIPTTGYIPAPMGGSGVRLRLTGGILGATLLARCAGLPNPFKDPDLHLQRAIVRGVGVTGGTMDLVLG